MFTRPLSRLSLAYLAVLGTQSFFSPAPALAAGSTITVNGATTYQTIDGFGASGAFHVASVLHGSSGLSPTQQQALMDLLFGQSTGAGLSILRNQIGSSSTACVGGPDDGDNVCSIEPNNPGVPNAPPTYVWDGSDSDQIWLSQQAMTRGVTQIYADAWSAPAYMKSNASLVNGGYLCGVAGHSCASGDWRQHYANYLIQYLQFYQTAGVPVTYLSFQNEPDLSPSYTGMNWDATNVPGSRGTVDLATPQNIDFIKNYLGPTLSGSGLSTKIACCEPTSWDRAISYSNGVLADATAAGFISLISGHGYYVAPSGMLGPNPITSAINAGKRVWETETSNFNPYNGTWDNGTPSHAGFQWAQVLHDALVNANVNAYLYWVLAWNNGTDNGFLVNVTGSTYTVPKRLWAFAGYSRYVRPGATRVSAVAPPGNLKPSAFRNLDGSVVIVVLNTGRNDVANTFSLQNLAVGSTAVPYLTNEASSMAAQAGIAISGGAFTATVPGRSMVTYRILP